MEIIIRNLEDLPRAAREFADHLGENSVFAFYGEMGAGKTTFVRALCEVLGVEDVVTSPTFAIVNEYWSEQLSAPIYHFDFYRIRRQEEVYDLGFDDYLRSGHLCLMEWPELIEELLPSDVVRVSIAELPDGSRRIAW